EVLVAPAVHRSFERDLAVVHGHRDLARVDVRILHQPLVHILLDPLIRSLVPLGTAPLVAGRLAGSPFVPRPVHRAGSPTPPLPSPCGSALAVSLASAVSLTP